jgi:ATPase family associated with various cellular activities (AAA)
VNQPPHGFGGAPHGFGGFPDDFPPHGFGPHAPGSAKANTALLVAFLSSLARRRGGELGARGAALLSSIDVSDHSGATQVKDVMESLVRELAPWIRGEQADGVTAEHGKDAALDSSIDLVDPALYDGVHYELDATTGPHLLAAVEDLQHVDVLRARGAIPPTRLLFDGPQGCGKTQAVFWIARQLGLKVAVVMLSKLISKWVGEAGKRFLKSVEEARKAGAVLLVDELDAVGAHRGSDTYGVTGAAQLVGAVNQVLEAPQNRDMLIVGATNLPDNIDPAIARRFETRVKFWYPDVSTRSRIAGHHWKLACLGEGTLDALLARTEDKSGDVVVRVCHAANRSAARRGRTLAAALPEEAAALAEAVDAAIGHGKETLPVGLGFRAVDALSKLRDGEIPLRGSVGGVRALLAELQRIEVPDVVAAMATLTREVPFDREPSRLVKV